MDIDTSTQKSPLLLLVEEHEQAIEAKIQQKSGLDIQCYDASVILDVSKEMALGYLVLLTGGSYEYKINTGTTDNATDGDDTEQDINGTKEAPQAPNEFPEIDEASLALAYAALTDGNVLYICFGLKSGPNGRVTNIIGQKQPTPIFCCFPSASTASLQSLVSSKGKKDVTKLVEVLRDVKDLEGTKGIRVDQRVVQSYVKCFATIVNYHDEVSLLKNASSNKSKENKSSMLCSYQNFFLALRNIFSSQKSELNLKMAELQKCSLEEIQREFNDLKLYLAEVQIDAISVAETGVTVDECKEDM